MPSVCFVAGDPSGDAHAASLVTALKGRLRELSVTGLGGPAMKEAGVQLLDDITRTASIGPFDAARHLGNLIRAKRLLDSHLREKPPDLVILVDFGDYNLPVIAPLVKRHGIKIAYYISPQLWAWGRFRLRYVRRYIDHMLVFFPFEEALYRKAGVRVTCVGHPLIENSRPSISKEEAAKKLGVNPWRITVGLLPGSREDELRRHLPIILAAARRAAFRMPGLQFLIPKAASISREYLEAAVAKCSCKAQIVEGPMADALQLMEGAIVASGTATLQAAMAGVPMVVIYRTSWPTYLMARAVVRIAHIAMVNVVAGRRVVPELIQHKARPRGIADALVGLLRDDARRKTMRKDLAEVADRLGGPGAVERAASVIIEILKASGS